MKLRITYLFTLLLLSGAAFAVEPDSTEYENDSVKVSYFFSSGWFLNKHIESKAVDTTLHTFQIYRRENQKDDFLINHGNAGQTCSSLRFTMLKKDMFEHGHNILTPYLTPSEDVAYYITDKPYSDLYFVSGSKKESVFHIVHSQNLTKNLNVGLRFDLTNSEGSYFNQKTDDRGLILNARFISSSKKYRFFSHFIYNRLKIAENGGLASLDDFENNPAQNSSFYPVNLTIAKNTVKRKLFYFGQSVDIVTDKKIKDIDSTKKIIRHYNPRLRLTHEFTFEDRSYIYSDEMFSSSYYQNAFLNPEKTYDSVYFYTLNNSIILSKLENDSTKNFFSQIQVRTGVKHMLAFNSFPDTTVQDLIVIAGLSTSKHSLMRFSMNGDYCFNGISQGDYNAEAVAEINKDFKNKRRFHSDISFSTGYFGPSFFDEHYTSNHFAWDYTFEHSTFYETALHSEYAGYKASVSHSYITNLIYFDVLARPKQYTLPVNITSFEIEKTFKVRNMRLTGHAIYQKADHENIVRIPAIVTKGTFSFNKYAFKKALLWGFGADVLFFTGYYADSYMPASMVLYQQNDHKIGEYPFLDFFITAKIKRARFFVKTEHLNAGLMGNKYYLLPEYPSAWRTFKFGISWIMMN
ncbi:MAG: putative porin [Bacteroidota bacterium]